MNLKITFVEPGKADGIYRLKASGCTAARLSWADENGPLDDWTAFAYIPLDACGKGIFQFQGGRAIPPEARYIHIRAVSDDLLSCEEALFPITDVNKIPPVRDGVRLCAMSDLHLSSKPGIVKRALQGAKDADALLLAGDMTNDGTKAQYELLKECIQTTLPRMKIFPVIGNHDMPESRTEKCERAEISNYTIFQKWILDKNKNLFHNDTGTNGYTPGPDGAYAVRIGSIEMIGLQAVTEKRKFLFEEGRQLEWLDRHLEMTQDIKWHIVLCHAPLLHHNPKRKAGENNPYLNRDKQLQEIVDRHGKIIFLSGHTHLSMDDPKGCVEWDAEHKNLYINDGSVRPTDLLSGELLQPGEWKAGTRLEILLGNEGIEITTYSIKDEKKHARGYYLFYI